MTTDTLDKDKLHLIITTYNMMCLTTVPDVPTLLFERWGFSEEDVRQAIGLQPEDDLMEKMSAYLEREFGIGDLS